jgi:hypothetical protein
VGSGVRPSLLDRGGSAASNKAVVASKYVSYDVGQPTGETVLKTRWVGHYVVVKCLAGPAMPAEDPDDPRGASPYQSPRPAPEVFHLQRFGQLRVEVSNAMEEGMLNCVTFIPLGSGALH